MLTALVAAAFVAGVAGAWSPCGFSMVDTLAPQGYGRRLGLTAVACVAFAAGALAGGVATFAGLALLGALLGAQLGTGGGAAAAIAAALLLLLSAAGDAAGRRIVPQIRRQVPESWRRVLPLPLAAALYGVLLGLGFTTFVLSFSVYALAAACLVLGEPGTGLAVGLAFAAGRIVPVVVLAPLQRTERGLLLAGAMGERPAILRALRATGAVALGAAALALALGGAPAAAATPLLTRSGTDPSWSPTGALAWQLPLGGNGLILRPGETPQLVPGTDTALGGSTIVWREGEELAVAAQDTLAVKRRIAAPGAEEPAISDRWLVWRARDASGDVLRLVDLAAPSAPAQDLARTAAPDRIGRPSMDVDRVVYDVAGRAGSRIEEIYLPTGLRSVLRRASGGALLLNPSEQAGSLLYVRSSSERQEVRIGPRRTRDGSADRSLFSMAPTVRRDAGHEPNRHRHGAGYPGGVAPRLPARAPEGAEVVMSSTALSPDAAYVSRSRRTATGTRSVVLALPRP